MSVRNARLVKNALQSIPHPKDRKVDQLQRRMRHNYKVEAIKDRRKQHDQLTAARFFWFRCQLEGPLASQPEEFFTEEVLEALIQLHIERNDVEIADLKKETKRPQLGRIKSLEEQRKFENSLFATRGLAAPEFCDKETREIMLEIWDGDGNTVTCVPTVNVVRRDHANIRGCTFEATKASLASLLLAIDEVRDAQEDAGAATSKTSQFRREAPAVKKTEALAAKAKGVKASATDAIASQGTGRRLLQAKRKQQLARHAALTRSRGLM